MGTTALWSIKKNQMPFLLCRSCTGFIDCFSVIKSQNKTFSFSCPGLACALYLLYFAFMVTAALCWFISATNNSDVDAVGQKNNSAATTALNNVNEILSSCTVRLNSSFLPHVSGFSIDIASPG